MLVFFYKYVDASIEIYNPPHTHTRYNKNAVFIYTHTQTHKHSPVTGLCAGLVGHILVMAVDEVKESVTLGAAVVHAQARVGGNDGLDLLVDQVTWGRVNAAYISPSPSNTCLTYLPLCFTHFQLPCWGCRGYGPHRGSPPLPGISGSDVFLYSA